MMRGRQLVLTVLSGVAGFAVVVVPSLLFLQSGKMSAPLEQPPSAAPLRLLTIRVADYR